MSWRFLAPVVTIRARTVFQVILIPWQHNDDEIALRAKETTLIRPLGPMLNHPFTDLLLQNIALLSSFFAVVWKCSTPCERRRARSLQFLADRACAHLPWAACDAAPHSCLNCCTGWGQHLAKSFMQHKPQGDRKSCKTGNTWFTNLHYLHIKSRNCTHAQRSLQHPLFSKVDEFPVQTSQCGCCPGRAIWRSCRNIIFICFPGFMYPSFRLFWDETQICHITLSMSLFLEDLVPRRRPVWMCGVWCPWLRTSKWDHVLSARLSCKRVVPNFNSRTSEFSQPRVSITNMLDHRCATAIF